MRAVVHVGDERVPILVNPGLTILDVVKLIAPTDVLQAYLEVFLSGQQIARDEWGNVSLQAQDSLAMFVVPQGRMSNEGKQVVGTALMLAAVVASYAIPFPGAQWLVLTQRAAFVAVTGAIISHNFAPRGPDSPEGGAFALGVGNPALPDRPIPKLYGRHIMTPALAALPDIQMIGEQSHYRMLLDFGLGDVVVDESTLTAGEQPLNTIGDTQFFLHQKSKVANPQHQRIPVHTVSMQKEIPYGGPNDAVTVRSRRGAAKVVVQIAFPGGLYWVNASGEVRTRRVRFGQFFYRKVGAATWSAIPEANVQGGGALTEAPAYVVGQPGGGLAMQWGSRITRPFVVEIGLDFVGMGLGTGQWEFNFGKVDESPDASDDCYVIAVKSYRATGPILRLDHEHTMLDMYVRQGRGKVSAIGTIMAVGTSRLEPVPGFPSETSNPAHVVKDLLWGDVNGMPVAGTGIDHQSFTDFGAYCNAQVTQDIVDDGGNVVGSVTGPRHTTNFVHYGPDTTQEIASSVLAVARSAIGVSRDAKYKVIIDQPQPVARQLLTPENSANFVGAKSFSERVDGFRVRFVDGEVVGGRGNGDWQPREVIAWNTEMNKGPTQYDPAYIREINAVGVTNWVEAYRFGRYLCKTMFHRSEAFELEMDVENLVVERGDRVDVAHDVPLVGGHATRIARVNGNTITTRTEVSGTPDSYIVRLSDGTVRQGAVTNIGPGGFEFDLDNTVDLHETDLIVFGRSDQVMADWLALAAVDPIGGSELLVEPFVVTRITPGPELTATLELVRYQPDVYTVDQEPLPDWKP